MISDFKTIIGNTPLIKISDKIYAKLETYNPTGSVKDRMVYYVINRAIERGEITKDTILCEATSGNTGIALSAVAASLGLPCFIYMPSDMSEERRQMIRVYGGLMIDAPPSDFEKAIEMRDQFLIGEPNAWSPMQFSNPDNVECHQTITAREISCQLEQNGKSWGAFIHGSGTGGTIEGVRRYIEKNKYGDVKTTKVCMVVPAESPHGIQGIGDGKDFLANPEDMDSVIVIETQEAIDRAKRFAAETGILVGISSGANILASEQWVKSNNPKDPVVTMLCDRGERYMSVF
jgi:cysteine synthase A|tara:strand:- start:347 stop:1216 length:870 start_codon:yes stop_codon:yes gene_type:complete